MTSVNRWALIWTLFTSLAVTAGASAIAADPSEAQAAATDANAAAKSEKEAKAKAEKEAKATAKVEAAAKAKAEKDAKAVAKATAQAEAAAKAKAEKDAKSAAKSEAAAKAQAVKDAKAAGGKTAETRAKQSKGAKAGAADSSAMASLARRTSDETVFHDLRLLSDLEAKLAAMPATADPWRVAGARRWIEASREEYLDNDEVGFDQAAYASAAGLVTALESGAAPVTKETVPAAQVWSTSTQLRAELWGQLETLKRDEGFPCAAAELAMMEVELQWAGHEHLDTGACDSDPHLQAAEKHGLAAEALAAQCRKPVPPPVVIKVEPPPVQLPTAEELKVPKDVHFALNKDFVGPGSRKVIQGVANVLLKYPSVFVHLTGHTDSRGSDLYNLALSQRRVHAVNQVLRDLGIDSTRVTIEFVGKSKLYAAEVSTKGYALNRRVEMDFQDAEGREIKAERTEADLQIEADKPPTPPPAQKPKVRIKTAPARPRPKPVATAPKPTEGLTESVPRLTPVVKPTPGTTVTKTGGTPATSARATQRILTTPGPRAADSTAQRRR